MVAAPADEGDHGDALYASSTPRSCLPCLQIATPATERGEVRSAGGRPRRWRRRRTALFRLPGNDSGRRASPGPLSGQRKPRPPLSPWVGTASSCTKLPGRVLAPIKPLGRARDGRQQRPTDRADAFAPCGTPLISSTDAASSTSDAAGGRDISKRCGSARWRARTRRVRAQPRTSRARYCCSRRRGDPLRYYGRLRLHAGRFVK